MKHLKVYESIPNKIYWKIDLKNYKLSLWKIGMVEPDLSSFLTIIRREIRKQYPKSKTIFIGYYDSWGYDYDDNNYYSESGYKYMGEVVITTEDRRKYNFENTVKKYNL